ncbi:putative Alkaline ceramidase 3 [Glarea lozoyensis 74030]|uniref:Putative Alkaline ceramidase 3 n=1 Tax=Glarea lozoyensis (strain ATCC 74030 / MF5533) TaxID=1104152 RepID=H0EX77_GLAL7|nr:putative Alkaline ceramidase 3 [Glarea lozoyensis 74030]
MHPMQLVDELSMIYTACLMCYATFSFSQSRTVRRVLGTSLLSLAVFITLYYHYLQDPVFHQNAFAIITAVVLFRSIVWRRKIGLPWGILLEGHGWWHLMTGFGSYFYLVWGIWLRHCLNERQDEYILSWPSYFSIPEVIPIKIVEGKTTNGVINGHTNGHTNGHLDREDRKSV